MMVALRVPMLAALLRFPLSTLAADGTGDNTRCALTETREGSALLQRKGIAGPATSGSVVGITPGESPNESETVAQQPGGEERSGERHFIALSQLNETLHVALRNYSREIELELFFRPEEAPIKNKVILAIIELFGLGMFGVDRCYMGQCCLGITKGVLLGGFGIWCIIDFFVIIFNCLACYGEIDAVGFYVKFTKETITPAFVVTLLLLCTPCFPWPASWPSTGEGRRDSPRTMTSTGSVIATTPTVSQG